MKNLKILALSAFLLVTLSDTMLAQSPQPVVKKKRTSGIAAFVNGEPRLKKAAEILDFRTMDDTVSIVADTETVYLKDGEIVGETSYKVSYDGCKEKYFSTSDKRLNSAKFMPKGPNGTKTDGGIWSTALQSIFFPTLEAKFGPGRKINVAGRHVFVYSYDIDYEHSNYVVSEKDQLDELTAMQLLLDRKSQGTGKFKDIFVFPYHGEVYVDAKTNDVIGFTREGTPPKESSYQSDFLKVSLGFAEITGGENSLVPVLADSVIVTKDGTTFQSSTIFGNYRTLESQKQGLITSTQATDVFVTPGSLAQVVGNFQIQTAFAEKSPRDPYENSQSKPVSMKTNQKRKLGKAFYAVSAINTALTACDLYTTFSMVGNGYRETNPIVGFLLKKLGKGGTGAVLGGATAASIYVSKRDYEKGKKFWWLAQIGSIAAHGSGCAINLSIR